MAQILDTWTDEREMNMLETDRLILRPFLPTDAPELYAIHQESSVAQWIPNESYQDPEEALDAIRFFADRVTGDTLPYVLAVQLKESGELIGDTGINPVEGDPEAVEIGFVIGEKYRSMGYATEAVTAMTAFAFDRWGFSALEGRVLEGNRASQRVLEKSGFFFLEQKFGEADDPYGKGMLIYQKNK